MLEISPLEKMKDLSIDMLRKALQSFLEENILLAKEVGTLEDEVDQYSDETYRFYLLLILLNIQKKQISLFNYYL